MSYTDIRACSSQYQRSQSWRATKNSASLRVFTPTIYHSIDVVFGRARVE